MTELDSSLPSRTASDAELIAAVRSGSTDAFGELYARHADAARSVARQYVPSASDADDVVSDAFERVLGAIRGGNGPDLAFRAYLFTVVRRLAFRAANGARRTEPTDDDRVFEGAIGPLASIEEPSLRGFESTAVARAFFSLPERWRSVLWYTDIEGVKPAQVAPILGLSANGVAALAYRAREGLRQAYLQEHLNDAASPECRATNALLGGYVRGGLSKRETAKVDGHLEDCAACRAVVLELGDVAQSMRGVVAPLVLGLAGMGALAGGLPLWGGLVGAGAGAGAAAPGGSGSGSSSNGAAAGVGAAAGTGVLAAAAASGGRTGLRAALVGAAAVGVVAVGLAVAAALGVFDSREPEVVAEPPAAGATVDPGDGADGTDAPAAPDDDAAAPGDEDGTADVDAADVDGLLPGAAGPGAGAAGGSAGSAGPGAGGSAAGAGPGAGTGAGTGPGSGATPGGGQTPGAGGSSGGSGGSTPTDPADPTGPVDPTDPTEPVDPPEQYARAADITVAAREGQTISAQGDTDLGVTVTNASAFPARGATVSIELPAWMSAQDASGGALGRAAASLSIPGLPFEVEDGEVSWTCLIDVGLAECTAHSIAPKATSTLSLPVQVAVDKTDNTSYELPTTVRVGNEERASTLEIAVDAYAEVTATVQENPALVLGQDGELTLEVTNEGQRTASEAWLSVELPEGLAWPTTGRLQLRDGSSEAWTCTVVPRSGEESASAVARCEADLPRARDTADELRFPVRVTAAPDGDLALASGARVAQPWTDKAVLGELVTVSLNEPTETTMVAGGDGPSTLSFELRNGSSRNLGSTTVTIELSDDLGTLLDDESTETPEPLPTCAVGGGAAVPGKVTDPRTFECSVGDLAALEPVLVEVELNLPASQPMGTYQVTATVSGEVPTGADLTRRVELTLAETAVDVRVDRHDFAWRWQATGQYSVTEVGAPLLYCDAELDPRDCSDGAGGGVNNNARGIALVPLQDAPREGSGHHDPISSVTKLNIPEGSEIAFAGLYWSAGYESARYSAGIPASEDTTTVWLRGPNGEYEEISGVQIARVKLGTAEFYQSYADVTGAVRKHGAGEWALADVAHPGGGPGIDQMMAGWALVVVYEDDVESSTVTIYDGGIAREYGQSSPLQLRLYQPADVAARLGVVAWEGDLGNVGDQVLLNGVRLTPHMLDGSTGSANNAFDSTARGFRYANSLGVDAKGFTTTSVLAGENVLTLVSQGDGFLLGVLTLQTFASGADQPAAILAALPR